MLKNKKKKYYYSSSWVFLIGLDRWTTMATVTTTTVMERSENVHSVSSFVSTKENILARF